MKFRPLPGLIAALITAALCCTGCFQELPLGDKYLNEAVGFLRVQNTSSVASYVFNGFELRNDGGEIIKTWDGLNLERGDIWTGDLDKEGSFTLYCTVSTLALNEKGEVIAKTVEVYEYGTVAIKLHEVTESKIIGEAFFTDTDKDGFSDSWERAYGFDPENNADGGPVYVASGGDDAQGRGTALSPYKTLAQGIKKARSGLSEETRTVLVDGILTRTSGNPGSDTAVMYIADTGPRGVTITGVGTSAAIDANPSNVNPKRAIYLGPGTKLTLKNITITGGYAYRGGGVYADGAALTLGPGAVIQKCRSFSGWLSGAGVYGSNGAIIVMKDGSLIGGDTDKGNEGSYGAGVALYDSSSLTMERGSRISGNKSNRCAAVAVDVGSLATLEDGAEISGNNDMFGDMGSGFGHGGGVRLTGGSKLLMKGGRIAENTLGRGGSGGGVYVGSESVFEMQGGTIRDNEAGEITIDGTLVKGNGGGVYVDSGGMFRMSGGEIANNTAKGKGGGVYVRGGSISKRGGTIYGSSDAAQNTMDSGTPNALYIDLATPISENGTLSGPVTYP